MFTRLNKFKEDVINKEWWLGGESEEFYLKACPYFLDCGLDDLDEDTKVGDYGNIKGCRGITCERCWNKEYDGDRIAHLSCVH